MMPLFLEGATLTGIPLFLSYVTEIVTSAVSWVTSYIGVVAAQPFLMLFILVPLVGLGIGLFKRLLRLN